MKKLLIFVLFVNTAFAQSFTVEQVLAPPFPTTMVASPVGNKVAFVLNEQGSRNIFVSENGQTRRIIQYSKDNGQEVGGLTFTNDGKTLVFVRGGAPNSAGELPNPAEILDGVERSIFKLDIDGKNLKKLGNGSYPKISPKGDWVAFLSGGQIWTVSLIDTSKKATKLFQVRGNQNSIRWSPDGSKIAFISSRGDHSFVGIYDFATKSVKFISPSVDDDQQPVWSPDGKQIAFLREPNEREDLMFGPKREALPYSIMVSDIESGNSKQIWQAKEGVGSRYWSGGLVADNNLFWTADNYLIFPYEGDGWHHLYSISPNGGTAKLLTSGNGEVEYATYSADKKSIIYNANINDIDRRHLWQVSGDGTIKQLTSGKGIEWSPMQVADGSVYCLHSDAISPATPAVLNNGTLKDIALDYFPKDFPFSQLVEPQAVTITATDGMQVPCQIFLPKNQKAGEKRPAAIFFHGGSRRQMLLGFNYGEYYHKSYAMHQYLVSKGYVVLSVNYRSGIGYGMEFREALNYGATGASEVADVIGAGLYLKNRADVDGSKICLWGGSYGGYLTAMGLVKAPDLFAVGVDIHGVHDWNTTTRNFIPTYDAAKRADWAKVAYASSPLPYISNWKAPVLLIHADDDRNVPFAETVTLAEELRKNKVYFEQLIFPDDVHSFLLHQNWVNTYKATADFFDRMLKK